jgi:uncharacterized protein
MSFISNHPLTQHELKQLHEFLSSSYKNKNPMNLTEAHGFLTAIVSLPHRIMPSQWQPILFDGTPKSKSIEQPTVIIQLIEKWSISIKETLQNNDTFEPLFFEQYNPVPIQEVSLDLAKQWCLGYIEGAELSDCWLLDNVNEDLLLPFYVLANQALFTGNLFEKGYQPCKNEADYDKVLQEKMEHKKETLKKLPLLIKEIYVYWSDSKNYNSIANSRDKETVKISRNAICPCGSGKKYKRCCLDKVPVTH